MFVDKAKDVVGLPLDPPEQELCLQLPWFAGSVGSYAMSAEAARFA